MLEKRKGIEDGTCWLWASGCQKHGIEPSAKQEGRQAPLVRRVEGLGDSKEELQSAMQQVVGPAEVLFKSMEQEQAMHAMMAGQMLLVVVLPMGEGKSLLFMLPACLSNASISIVVVLYPVLVKDMVSWLRRAGIDCLEWKPSQVNLAAAVVVSANFVASWEFLDYALLLSRQPKLVQLKGLCVLACPIVLLMATLLPVLEEELGNSMMVRCATYIWASTVRPNIQAQWR